MLINRTCSVVTIGSVGEIDYQGFYIFNFSVVANGNLILSGTSTIEIYTVANNGDIVVFAFRVRVGH